MTYRELLKLYKEGKLDDIQKEKVEKDIERQDAISEFLFDREEMPEFNGIEEIISDGEDISKEDTMLEDADRESDKFTKMIQSAIRKTFIKMGVIVGITILVLVCFIIFALPQIVDLFYYDPSEAVGVTEDGFETNRISLDMAVYSELFMPRVYRDNVEVTGNGNGKYDIMINQYSTYTGLYTDVAGTINKGKLTLYNPNILTRPTGNAFNADENVLDDHMIGVGAAGTYEEALKEVQNLDEKEYYIGYVTLDKIVSYSEFSNWAQENQVDPQWCAVCFKSKTYDKQYDKSEYFSVENIGFIYRDACRELTYDREKYPLLSQYDVGFTAKEEENWVVSEENMTQHMISMLRYMADAKEFGEMMEFGESFATEMNEYADNIEQNGLNIYGFAVIGQKEELLRICELEEMDYIYTTPFE